MIDLLVVGLKSVMTVPDLVLLLVCVSSAAVM